MSTQAVYPIDTLLVSRLEDILNGERALHARYALLGASANTPETRNAFSQELSQLKESADRLYRLVTAMDSYSCLDSDQSPALA